MLQRTSKKISKDFLNHAIPNDEPWWFRFWGVGWVWECGSGLALSLSGVHYMARLVYEAVTSVLAKFVVLSGFAWITLSVCKSFALPFCFANFVNWRLLSDSMELGLMDI